MVYEQILYSTHDGICRIALNRPEHRNAQGRQLLEELDDAMRRAEGDANVRVVILAAEGVHFSAGHDLKESQRDRPNLSVEQRWEWEEEHYLNYCLRIWDLKKPTIAEVRGACIAAGFMLVNMCDLIVASDDAYFADPVAHSIGAASVEVLVHPWALGARKAKELLYTGGKLTAADALAAGMVNRVVPRDELEDATKALAARIAEAPPFGLRLMKKSINRVLDIQGFRNSIQAHFDTHQLSHESETFRSATQKGLSGTLREGKAKAAS
jgi:enoyl-CoA hydratase